MEGCGPHLAAAKEFDVREDTPWAHKLIQRRMIVIRSTYGAVDPLLTWVDDEGSCPTAACDSHWHSYLAYDTYRRVQTYNIRCPKSLSEDEFKRIITDDPEGSCQRHLEEFLRTKGRLGHQYLDEKSKSSKTNAWLNHDA